MTDHAKNHPVFYKSWTKPYDMNNKKYYPFIDKNWFILYTGVYFEIPDDKDPTDTQEVDSPYYKNDKMMLNHFTATEHDFFKRCYESLHEYTREYLEEWWCFNPRKPNWLKEQHTVNNRFYALTGRLSDILLEKLPKATLFKIIKSGTECEFHPVTYMRIWTNHPNELEISEDGKFKWNKKRLIFDH